MSGQTLSLFEMKVSVLSQRLGLSAHLQDRPKNVKMKLSPTLLQERQATGFRSYSMHWPKLSGSARSQNVATAWSDEAVKND